MLGTRRPSTAPNKGTKRAPRQRRPASREALSRRSGAAVRLQPIDVASHGPLLSSEDAPKGWSFGATGKEAPGFGGGAPIVPPPSPFGGSDSDYCKDSPPPRILSRLPQPNERLVDKRLHFDLVHETDRLQVLLNQKEHERKEKQLQFDTLMMAVQSIALEKVPESAVEEASYLQHQVRFQCCLMICFLVKVRSHVMVMCLWQLWAIEEATRAEWKYEKALRTMATRARDEQRAVKAEINVYQRSLGKTKRETDRCVHTTPQIGHSAATLVYLAFSSQSCSCIVSVPRGVLTKSLHCGEMQHESSTDFVCT